MSKTTDLVWWGVGALGAYACWEALGRQRVRTLNTTLSRGRRIVVLGAGFAGRNVALGLAKGLPDPADGEIVLVDSDPYLLFTPMLTEAAGGELDTDHIACPAEHLPSRIRFAQGRVKAIDLKEKRVTLLVGDRGSGVPETERTETADHLVIALGSQTNYRDIPGLAEVSLPMKGLQDASKARNRLLSLLERADEETDPAMRRALLTLVVGGGGYTGVETMAALNDLLRDELRKHPNLWPEEVRTVLATPGKRLLPELDERLAGYAQRKLVERGVEVMLGAKVTGAGEGYVELDGRERIPTYLLIWAGGVKPIEAIQALECQRGKHGGVVVDATCAVVGHPGIWAMGDCAEVPQPDGHGSYAPTAQNATRQGTVVAENILASLRGQPTRPFTFRPLGELALVGKRSGVAQVFGFRFSGPIAWAMWRAIYWVKMPDMGQRIRILLDWVLDVAFGRNLVGAPVPVAPSRPAG